MLVRDPIATIAERNKGRCKIKSKGTAFVLFVALFQLNLPGAAATGGTLRTHDDEKGIREDKPPMNGRPGPDEEDVLSEWRSVPCPGGFKEESLMMECYTDGHITLLTNQEVEAFYLADDAFMEYEFTLPEDKRSNTDYAGIGLSIAPGVSVRERRMNERSRFLTATHTDSFPVVVGYVASGATATSGTQVSMNLYGYAVNGFTACNVINAGATVGGQTLGHSSMALAQWHKSVPSCNHMSATGKMFGPSEREFFGLYSDEDDDAMALNLEGTVSFSGGGHRHTYVLIGSFSGDGDDGSVAVGSHTASCSYEMSSSALFSQYGGTGSLVVKWTCPTVGYGCQDLGTKFVCGLLASSGSRWTLDALVSKHDAYNDY